MVSKQGIVEGARGGTASVRVQPDAACAHCASRDSCHVTPGKDFRIEVDNDIAATEGDRVEISVPSGALLKLSILVYLLPILALVAGAVAGKEWFEASPGQGGEIGSVICGILAMGVTFLVLKRVDHRARQKSQFRPRATRIVATAACDAPPDDSKSARTADTVLPRQGPVLP